jgi:hypothetical protein
LLSCLPFLPSLPEKGRLFFGMGGLEWIFALSKNDIFSLLLKFLFISLGLSVLYSYASIQENERQEGKTGPVWGWVSVGGGRVNRHSEDGQIWSMYLVCLYENKTLKLS